MKQCARKAACLCLFFFLASSAGAPAHADEGSPGAWQSVRGTFRTRLGSAESKEKQRAFECLRGRVEAEALDELLAGYWRVRAEGDSIRNLQEKTEREYEDLMNRLIATQAKGNQAAQNPRELETFNKTVKKLSGQIEEQRETSRNLESSWSRNRALLDSATDVASSILAALSPEQGQVALTKLRAAWIEGKDPEGVMRWMDALAPARSAGVTVELLRALEDEKLPPRARVAALTALAERREPQAVERATDLLKRPPEDFALVTAAVAALRKLHDRRGIAPLIEFLGRKDLGRLREDARDALVSLTGQEHGPYLEPWSAWWTENEKSFVMPQVPYRSTADDPENRSKTFYGIHTFSDRVLYIVDLSESMNWAPGTSGVPGGSHAKIVRLREELAGAVNSLDDGGNFNVIAFNHAVVTWGGQGVVVANETSRRKLARWVQEMKPSGLTNIHDALETGFRLILQSTGRPLFDTIFFLTDGKPTGGKMTDPKLILEAVRDWNSVANTTIHVIGIGQAEDVDEQFLQELAAIGHGKYVRRDT